ncbi:MAG: DUF1566 domain-containing protein, partial [Campylobacterota bacterium]|nr:DUF1566 domain-containing protein [Campylobacterota bacterium]
MKILFYLLFVISLYGEFIRDNSNNTVTDNTTGLIWQDGSDIPSLDWEGAVDYCENLEFAGQNDWRLPNRNELYSIVDLDNYNPAINSEFKNIQNNDYYWSSTSYSSSYAWGVYFYYGYSYFYYKSYTNCVRCVRGGQYFNTLILFDYNITGEYYNDTSITFKANDEQNLTYSWEIDEVTKTGKEVIYSFDSVGSYPIKVTATNSEGDSVTKSETITITQAPNIAPTLAISANKTSIIKWVSVDFLALASDEDGSVTSVIWSYGTQSKTGLEATFTFNEKGIHTISATATDDLGKSTTKTINIEVVNQKPTADDIEIEVNSLTATVINLTGDDKDGGNLTYIVTTKSVGTLSDVVGSQIIYNPINANDSFTYKSYDGEDYSDIATVSIKYKSENITPTCTTNQILINNICETKTCENGGLTGDDCETQIVKDECDFPNNSLNIHPKGECEFKDSYNIGSKI